MTFLRIARGKIGENVAAKELKRQGYRILLRNYSCRIGEIDLIAEKKGTLVFVEVKSKTTSLFGLPQESVTFRKQEKIRKVAQMYLMQTKQYNRQISFCVIAVQLDKQGRLLTVELIENAF
jgi:putative endonuclease